MTGTSSTSFLSDFEGKNVASAVAASSVAASWLRTLVKASSRRRTNWA